MWRLAQPLTPPWDFASDLVTAVGIVGIVAATSEKIESITEEKEKIAISKTITKQKNNNNNNKGTGNNGKQQQ